MAAGWLGSQTGSKRPGGGNRAVGGKRPGGGNRAVPGPLATSQIAEYRIQDTGYNMQHTGYRNKRT